MRALLLALLAAAPLGASARPKVAVLDIRAVQGVQPGTATILTAIVVDDTARAGFDVVSQADVSAMLGFEKQKRMLGCSEDSSCLAEIGGALGADYVLSGQVGQIGSRYHLSFQLLDAKRARVVGRAARFSDRDEDALAAAAQTSVKDLLATVPAAQKAATAKAGEPPPPAPRPEAAKAPAAKPAPARADLAAKPPAATAAAVKKAPFRPSKALAWGTVGAGGAMLLVGALAGSRAKATRDELANAWQDPDYASIYASRSADVNRLEKTANVFYVLGLATTGVGGWLVWKHRATPIAVAPVAGGGEVGLVASGSF